MTKKSLLKLTFGKIINKILSFFSSVRRYSYYKPMRSYIGTIGTSFKSSNERDLTDEFTYRIIVNLTGVKTNKTIKDCQLKEKDKNHVIIK